MFQESGSALIIGCKIAAVKWALFLCDFGLRVCTYVSGNQYKLVIAYALDHNF